MRYEDSDAGNSVMEHKGISVAFQMLFHYQKDHIIYKNGLHKYLKYDIM
jgi:hypothetical protein